MTRDPERHEDGTLRDVDRIEFCRLDFGRFQWNLWSDGVLIHSETGGAGDLPALLGMTSLFLQPPEDGSDGEKTCWTDQEKCEFPKRLD